MNQKKDLYLQKKSRNKTLMFNIKIFSIMSVIKTNNKKYSVEEKYVINGIHYYEVFHKGNYLLEFESEKDIYSLTDEDIEEIVEFA